MYNDLISIGSWTLHSYGVLIGIGYVFAIIFSGYRAKKRGLNVEAILDIGIIAIIFGLGGAKLLFVIVEFKSFLNDPWSVISSEGFVVYGGIILAVAAAIVYCKKKKFNFISYFDIAMPAVAGAQGFGRLGCLMAGCCYGRETDSFLGIQFPHGSMAPSGVKLFPTQAISAGGNFLIMAVLLVYARKTKYKGNVGALYFILNGIGRFIIEFFRDDYRGSIGVISTSQFIALLLIAVGIGLMIICSKKKIPADRISVDKVTADQPDADKGTADQPDEDKEEAR